MPEKMNPDAIRDKRRLPRYSAGMRGDFSLILKESGGGTQSVRGVRDISSEGVSIYIERAVDAGTPVALRCTRPQTPIEVTGIVVWCAKESDGFFSVGINLLSPVLLKMFLGLE